MELQGCDPAVLDDLNLIEAALVEAAAEMGVHLVGKTFHKFSPQGVTGIVAIAESHLCIHTWPEFGYAAVDIFTCGNFHPDRAAAVIVRRLRSSAPSLFEVKRGILAPPAQPLPDAVYE